ncbi:Oidioi.mRNA.OKI2018_I69.PAR.g13048.t1.cds [Oikopleura dioica]|uniref:Oidioi.mRNA.OKI2018_I69.PAR.g13048.t1.cds n=1 Tax=Oikopleura dioica TaxID=34765 RepID=A0ABN7SAS9_OIKDI|nr:Oidioi.mRNA.OKI2018_I69.PAR.g13048.t1.cds [Oikopleura dioica]
MTSLRWNDESVNDRPIWTHIVHLIVPKAISNPDSFFLQSSNFGNFIQPARKRRSLEEEYAKDLPRTKTFAIKTGVVCGLLNQNPNYPIRFTADSPSDPFIYGVEGQYFGKHSDGVLAQAWKNFITSVMGGAPDFNQLGQPVMAKATIRALDLMAEETFQKQEIIPSKLA